VSIQFANDVGGFIGGVIFLVIGLVLMIIGFKGQSKKEKKSGQ
jgi:putative Mn2+ efflux pump MntP